MSDSTCSVASCERPMRANTYCIAHNTRFRTFGDPKADVPLRPRRPNAPAGPCEVDSCERPRFAKGYCTTHYERTKRFGDPQADIPIQDQSLTPSTPCVAEECGRTPTAGGLCGTHRSRRLRTGKVEKRVVTAEMLAARAEAKRTYQREWKAAEYARNTEAVRARSNAWRAANPERVKMSDAIKYRRRKNSPALPFSVTTLALKWAYWGGKCWMCGSEANSWDHVKPLNQGGWHMVSNMRPACTPCNSRKRDKWPYSPPQQKAA